MHGGVAAGIDGIDGTQKTKTSLQSQQQQNYLIKQKIFLPRFCAADNNIYNLQSYGIPCNPATAGWGRPLGCATIDTVDKFI